MTLHDRAGASISAGEDGNKQFDAGDYKVWRAHFSQTAGSGAGVSTSVAVPEPATPVLLLVGTMAMFSLQRAIVS